MAEGFHLSIYKVLAISCLTFISFFSFLDGKDLFPISCLQSRFQEEFVECVKAEQVRTVSHSPLCTVWEYDMQEKEINAAVVKIKGRYPERGWAVNETCKMMGFVLAGSGQVAVEGKILPLAQNDLVLILPGEKYYWDGEMTLLLPATPAWYPGQYKLIGTAEPKDARSAAPVRD
jgi:mannose-6-phosphate isomerase-like protein (cupin superfamily)